MTKQSSSKKRKKTDLAALAKSFQSIQKVAGEAVTGMASVQNGLEKRFVAKESAAILEEKLDAMEKILDEGMTWQRVVRTVLPPAAAIFVMLIPTWIMPGSISLGYLLLIAPVCGLGWFTDWLVKRALRTKSRSD